VVIQPAEAQTISDELVEKFREIDCASVADGVTGLGLNGVVQGLSPVNPKWKICGRAVTMRQVPLQEPDAWSHEGTDVASLISICKPGDIIVVDNGGRLDVAIFGGGSATKLKNFGIGGIVVDGACRDREELLALDCPTYVRGVCLVHPQGLTHTVSVNTDVVQIGVAPMVASVAPGDLIVGDMDGIVVVPASRASEVLHLATRPHS
jgi:4-hydroxy-4-methyl-2-oxoglutarate aldolase